ncbi:MAG: hypothetical protein FWF12_10505 [Betaproteobacteria bacterium]|nr:hypothetical protein [Betaproteobacteria bacterium]
MVGNPDDPFEAALHHLQHLPKGIALLTIQHQARDIESLIVKLTLAFHAKIERLKRKI